MSGIKPPKVFISYAWGKSTEHVQKVEELATRLANDGIYVIFDQWDVEYGNDLNAFMEQSVISEEVDKVLMICNKDYMDKANGREGGVGKETQIITPKVYGQTKQNKFVPVLFEKDEGGNAYLPAYLQSAYHIDFVDGNQRNYEKLIRHIYSRPEKSRPALGQTPAFLFEEKQQLTTTALVRDIKDISIRDSENSLIVLNEFSRVFFRDLEQYRIPMDPDLRHNLDQVVYERIETMKPLRDYFIQMVEVISHTRDDNVVDEVILLFEKLYEYTLPYFGDSNSHFDGQEDHYKVLLHELFLYTITIFILKRNYWFASRLIKARYFVRLRQLTDDVEPVSYMYFRGYAKTIEEQRKARLNLNFFSLTAELLKTNVYKNYRFEELRDTDLLLFYFSLLEDDSFYGNWFPITYVYSHRRKIELLQRMVSNRHFERVKELFDVKDVNGFVTKFNSKMFTEKYMECRRGYSGAFESIPSINQHINFESIASLN